MQVDMQQKRICMAQIELKRNAICTVDEISDETRETVGDPRDRGIRRPAHQETEASGDRRWRRETDSLRLRPPYVHISIILRVFETDARDW